MFDKNWEKLARSPNMVKRPKYLLKNLFPQNPPMDRQKAVFTALSSFFGEKLKISWFSETDKKTHYFLRESTFLRNVSVKNGKLFCQPRRKISDIKPNFFLVELPKAVWKTHVFQKVKIWFHGHQENSFDNTPEKVSTSGQNFSTQNYKMLKNIYFSQKDYFSSTRSY